MSTVTEVGVMVTGNNLNISGIPEIYHACIVNANLLSSTFDIFPVQLYRLVFVDMMWSMMIITIFVSVPSDDRHLDC